MFLVHQFSGEDAYTKIRAGATLVQLYTAFAYGGPALIPQIKVPYYSHIITHTCFNSICMHHSSLLILVHIHIHLIYRPN